MTINIEKEFMNEIDCIFPYSDKTKCLQLIDKAVSISPASVYAIVYELAYLPNNENREALASTLLELLDVIDCKFEHPLKAMVFEVVRVLIHGQHISAEESNSKMLELKDCEDAGIPFNIIYFACDDVNGDTEAVYNEVVEYWKLKD